VESDGLGLGWRLAWWLPFAAAMGLLLITDFSHRGPSRSIALALLVFSGVILFVVLPLVVRHRRRSGWTKVKRKGRWQWLRPGESPEGE